MNEELNFQITEGNENSVSKTESPIAAFNISKKTDIRIDPVHIDFSTQEKQAGSVRNRKTKNGKNSIRVSPVSSYESKSLISESNIEEGVYINKNTGKLELEPDTPVKEVNNVSQSKMIMNSVKIIHK